MDQLNGYMYWLDISLPIAEYVSVSMLDLSLDRTKRVTTTRTTRKGLELRAPFSLVRRVLAAARLQGSLLLLSQAILLNTATVGRRWRRTRSAFE